MGYSDIGCYGGEIETPALDSLASQGVRFRNFYNTARCSISRAALMTGLYPWQAGVGQLDNDLGAPGYRGYLNDQCVTIAEALGQAGYHTSISGKWHIGKQRPHWPIDRGFQRQFTSPAGGGYYYLPVQPQIAQRDIYLDEQVLSEAELDNIDGNPDRFYSTDDFTDVGLDFIDEAISQEKPFFLYLPFIAPHFPLEAPAAEVQKYLDAGTYDNGWEPVRAARLARQKAPGGIAEALNGTPGEWSLSPDAHSWSGDADAIQYMAVYAAVVDRMDQNIGRLVEHLEEAGELENTIIIFLSDNGASSTGGVNGAGELGDPVGGPDSVNIHFGSGWANASNTPFRKYKGDTENGGIAAPCIIHWPAGVSQAKGTVLAERAHLIDIMPTLLELADVEYPLVYQGKERLALEGESLAPLLAPANSWTRQMPLFFEHEGASALIREDWKAVAQDDPIHDGFELYDLSQDPQELNNLASEHTDLVDEMSEQWMSWAHASNVKDWNPSGLPQISLQGIETMASATGPAPGMFEVSASSDEVDVYLDYGGDAVMTVDYATLPESIHVSSAPEMVSVDPLASGGAGRTVALDVSVRPNFWYVEPDNKVRIFIHPITYAQWVNAALPGAVGFAASPSGDYNQNGVSNLIEFIQRSDEFEISPFNPADLRFGFSPANEHFLIRYKQGAISNEAQLTLEVSSDLVEWEKANADNFFITQVIDGSRVLQEYRSRSEASALFGRLNWQWLGEALGDLLVLYAFDQGDVIADSFQDVLAGDYDPRFSAFGDNVSGTSSLNGGAFLRSNGTADSLAGALAGGHYHELTINFANAPSTVTGLKMNHQGSSGSTTFTSNVAVFVSVDGFAQAPLPEDAVEVSSVEVSSSQNPQEPIREIELDILKLGLENFQGTLTVRIYFFDSVDEANCIHRIDNVAVYGFAE